MTPTAKDSAEGRKLIRNLVVLLIVFGAVFLTIRWWKQSDPLRSSRLRIAPILMAVMLGIVAPVLALGRLRYVATMTAFYVFVVANNAII